MVTITAAAQNEVANPGERKYKFRIWDTEKHELKSLTTYIERNVTPEFFMAIFEMRSDQYPLTEWTGLQDSRGVEIYEGDIVEAQNQGFSGTFEVRFRQAASPGWILYPAWQGGQMWYLHGAKQEDGSFTDSVRVIGNVFENPELRPKLSEESGVNRWL